MGKPGVRAGKGDSPLFAPGVHAGENKRNMPFNLAVLNTAFLGGTRAALDLVFPLQCPFCAIAISSTNRLFCDDCLESLAPSAATQCASCGAPIAVAASSQTISSCDCQKDKWRFRGVVALGRYEGQLRQAVLRMKHRRGESLAWAMGRFLFRRQGERIKEWKCDLVVPIPGHRSWGAARGGWSAATLAAALAKELRLPARGDLLAFQRKIKQQHMLSLSERRANVRGSLRQARGYDISGARVLLVDDVMTSGATVDEAARALHAAGAEQVVVAVVARALGE